MVSQSNISIWRKCVFILFAIFVSFSATISESYAQPTTTTTTTTNPGDSITGILCKVIEQISGPIGKAIAVLIVISLAIALFLGKVSWGMAIAVAVGMGILFGAESVVQLISPGDGTPICA